MLHVLTIHGHHPRNEVRAEFGGILVFVTVVKLAEQDGGSHAHIILFLFVTGR